MPSQSSQNSSLLLVKRHAESDLDGEPPIKKLELLHLGSTDDQTKTQDELADSDNFMHLDDTRHTSYIYDIERELASIEAEEKRISFLPDIEKALNAVPQSIISAPKPEQNELVLYRVPHSLTVAEDQDNVRKAIIESRARVRARQAERGETAPAIVPSAEDKDNSAFVFEAGDPMDLDSQQQ